jgi:hypothetical protein
MVKATPPSVEQPSAVATPAPPPAPRPTRPSPFALVATGLGAALALALSSGCRSNELGMVGVSDRPPVAPRARPPSSAVPAASSWATPQALAPLTAVDDRPRPSLGHNPPAWAGVVHVSPDLVGSYQTLGSSHDPWPVGAIIVERHTAADGSSGPAYAMRKLDPGMHPEAGDWSYAVLSSDGTPKDVGDLSFCARCHADAPHEFLFGPRTEVRRRLHGAPGQGSASSPGTPSLDDEASSPPEDTPPPRGPGDPQPRPSPPRPRR